MSNDILSQEEIEALLRGEPIASEEVSGTLEDEFTTDSYLTEMEQDALGEIGNISFGSSATALSALLGQKVEITTPTISVVDKAKIEKEFVHPYAAVNVHYTAGLSGTNLLVIKQSDAAIIADLMLGGDGREPNGDLGEIHLSAVQEAMNQMMGSAATSMSTVFNKKVDISPPSINLIDFSEDEGREHLLEEELMIRISFSLKVGDLIDSNIMQLLPLKFGKELVGELLGGMGENETAAVAEMVAPVRQVQEPSRNVNSEQRPVEPINEPVYQEQHTSQQQHRQMRAPEPQVQVQQAQFASFDAPSLTQGESQNLDLLLDIPLQVTVELGRTKRSVKEILEISGGSIIELDKLAGEPVDILVNSRLIAKGEVVVIDENFGVRITDILSQADRLNNLR
ncbi:flagellar motor switch phosphatase FliY [Sporosarcina siberiensis]|uniref:Flagellar motor switch phosphatase FliY n=1 Tax=Sporosarcina siberiensis TaxID=1365606 RepID=A0ABW4SGQ8_9BACL